jgi:bifunctional non-homologous end joining protein LigD
MARPRRDPRSIDAYRKKRDFTRTPEPAPGSRTPGPGDPVFVIHRHDARRLHYDLRLEMGGVLKSFAVPRGFSWDPNEKRLAVRTEDHPMEYETFEGEIPRGQYGAGTLKLWDQGRYQVLNGDPIAALDAGKLEIRLRGRRTRGEWHLVRTKGKEGEDPWLLFKARDLYARADDGDDFGPWLAGAVEEPFPTSRDPMRASVVADPFSDPAWVFEVVFEGRRVLVFKHGGDVRLHARDVAPPPPPELSAPLLALRAEQAVLDGVLVALDGAGRPSKDRLVERLQGRGNAPLCLYVFDLIHWDGWDLRDVSLIDRKAALATVLPKNSPLLFVDHVPGDGVALARVTAETGLTAIVGKRSASPYRAGIQEDWRLIPVAPSSEARKRSIQDSLGDLRSRAPTNDRFRFTNLGKVYWPEDGYTKGDLIDFYAQVSAFILPHLEERPVHMRRCPEGIHGEFFYQREAPGHLPDWIETESLPVHQGSKAVRHMVCNTRDALLYLINLGSIDLHPWLSRRATPENPDWAAIDLDPKDAPFEHVVRLARAIGKLLRAIEVRAWLKTSGSTGLHIYIPLRPGYTYDHSRMFCEGVCRVIAREHKDIATVERGIGQRGGKVYLDFLQNRRGQTLVPPYCVRPRPGATVSAPLHWEELDGNLHPSRFTIKNLPDRISRHGDLFRGVLEEGQDLLPAIDRLQQLLRG